MRSKSPNLDNLKLIHKYHLYHIPFENLSIHSNNEIILDQYELQKKILDSNRGGYCYELNGMFYLLLKELGYNVKIISARVNNGKGGWGEEFDHLAMIVELDELWLTDVGFGDNFIEPIRFEPGLVQKNLNGFYKIEKHDDQYFKLMKSLDGKDYSDEYIFTLKERTWNEFEAMNKYHQTSPDSHFTKKKVCTIAKENGRLTMTNDKLIFTEGDKKETVEIKDENEFNEKLFEYFGIKI